MEDEMRKRRIRQVSRKEQRKLWITEMIMVVLAVIWFIPVYYLIVTTLKSPQEATQSPLGLPKVWMFENYVQAWNKMEYPRALFNTVQITVLAVAIIVLITSLAGYAMARTRTKWGNRFFLLFLAGLMVPFQMNIVSLFKIVKTIGLMNTVWAVILVDVAINIPQGIFLFKEFIESSVPRELEEAAEIDGCSVIQKFFVIVLPLLKPVIATVVIIVTLNVWNEFMTPLLFIQSRENSVILQEVSRNIGQFSTDWTALFPMLMLGVAPLMLFYLFMQKYIIAGVAAGAVKG
ncbi:MAG: carbohydrate ABC transporter permease [Lachnospiraceae bacterium]|nr:carbohydrate ABC transporter permease [Lachnospiraceae bacterium]